MSNKLQLSELVKDISQSVDMVDLNEAIISGRISAEITIARENLGLTQTDFASMMGVTQAQVSKWENGGCNFSVRKLCEISEKLGLRLSVKMEKPREHTHTKSSNVIPIFSKSTWATASSAPTSWKEENELEEM